MDNSGFSKGYGFVRFGSEDEQKDALITMNGYVGLGTKALKICNAVPKPKGTTTASTGTTTTTSTFTTAGTDYSQYYDPATYWQNYASWQSVIFLICETLRFYFYVKISFRVTITNTILRLLTKLTWQTAV